MARFAEKIQAIRLRRKGESVKDIASELGVGKSTVSLWVRDIVLTETQKTRLRERMISGGHKGRMLGALANKEKKLRRIEFASDQAKRRMTLLKKNELFFVGLGLYWGEGVKSESGGFAIVNSDPRVIQIMIRWFTDCFGVDASRFRPRIFINELHRDRERKLIRFWSEKTEVPQSQFAKTVFIPRGKKVYENRETYYGVMALHVSKGRDLRYQVLAYIGRLAEIGINAGVVQELERGTHKP